MGHTTSRVSQHSVAFAEKGKTVSYGHSSLDMSSWPALSCRVVVTAGTAEAGIVLVSTQACTDDKQTVG